MLRPRLHHRSRWPRVAGLAAVPLVALTIWVSASSAPSVTPAPPPVATYYVSIVDTTEAMLDHGRPSTEIMRESDGVTGLGPNGENSHEISFWLYADFDDHGNPIGAIPQDLDVHFVIEPSPDPALPATLGGQSGTPTAGDDYYLRDMEPSQMGSLVGLVSGTWGEDGAVYSKRLRAGVGSNHWRNRMRLDALPEVPSVDEGGLESVQVRIVDLVPIGTPQFGYEVSSFNNTFRWMIVDRP
jgi:hypothetical protein